MIKFLRSRKSTIIVICMILLYSFYKAGNDFIPIEELAIPSAVGNDIIFESNGEKVKYKVPVSVYNYGEGKSSTNLILEGINKTLGETREDRQQKLNRRVLIGLEKVLIVNEDFAKFGIRNVVDILFTNRNVNDTSRAIVCKDKAEDIIKLKIQGYPSSGDYIEGLLERLVDQNFGSLVF